MLNKLVTIFMWIFVLFGIGATVGYNIKQNTTPELARSAPAKNFQMPVATAGASCAH